jgi:hypothetical protein
VKWEPTQLPILIDKLRELVEAQFNEADRAIVGLGDFALSKSHAKHRCTVEFWRAMTPDQRRKASAACFRRPSVPTSTSSDGVILVPSAPGGSKKPHQVKRARNERSRTMKRSRLSSSVQPLPSVVESESDDLSE